MSTEKSYVAAYSPDKDKLAELLTAIKGPNRTMAQFADESGVGASTLSRIANGRITKPLAESVIQAIYAHRVEDTDVSLDQLYHANGYVEEKEVIRRASSYDRHSIRMRAEADMKKALTNELFTRGIQIQRVPLPQLSGNALLKELTKPIPFYQVCDLAINATIDGKDYEWGFFIVPEMAEPTGKEIDDLRFIRNLIRRYSLLFLEDAWGEKDEHNERMSFVFRSYPYHEAFRKALENAPLRSEFTSICMLPDLTGVYEEVGLGKNGASIHGVMNIAPIVTTTQDDDDFDAWDDEGGNT